MVDHQAFLRAAADYAQALLTDYNIGTVLYQLTDHVIDVLGANGSGVSLARKGKGLTFVSASDGHVAELERHQIAWSEGPCHEAYRRGEVIAVADLASDPRWPKYRTVALEAGAGAVLGIPMVVRERRIGTLSVYHGRHEWDAREVEMARVLANMASGYIFNAGELARSTSLAAQLQQALDSRVVIEQAKGILAERNQITVSDAFDRMRKDARTNNRRIHDLARQIIAGTCTH